LRIPALTHLDPKLDPGHPPMMQIDSFEALVGAAQMNVVEFHTWNALSKRIEQPDRMTFDLDPGEGVSWPQMLEAAQLVHALLDELGLVNFLKTSGGKGLHVVVPLTPRADWDTVKDFSAAVVRHLAKVLPDRFVAKSGARNRVGKIFVDYLRNGRGGVQAREQEGRQGGRARADRQGRGHREGALRRAHRRRDQGRLPEGHADDRDRALRAGRRTEAGRVPRLLR